MEIFQNAEVLEQSLLIRPSQIADKLVRKGEPDGWHRIAYDRYSVHVCSEAEQIEEVSLAAFGPAMRSRIEHRTETVEAAIRDVFASLSRPREIRTAEGAEPSEADQVEKIRSAPQLVLAERARRLERFRTAAAVEGDALFTALGVEAWATGSQLLAITRGDDQVSGGS